ncbi:MAG: D-Ala-D-Ala carboxypeptidase family metallohydrolase, partial [Propionibacteriaceae bacterium]|nr:D-Ala-D-Ala carboxypeptidase family metallohydrolase [Propionibacteriaceae bacterium]
HFQQAWSLGPALTIDGEAGPLTRAALRRSLERKAAGKPDISAHFSAREFACNCAGRWPECRRIIATRALIAAAEWYRALIGPYTPERAYRCTQENARVGGVRNSQHLLGRGIDVPVYDVSVSTVAAARKVTGIGYYVYKGRRVIRHLDVRDTHTTAAPAIWSYGTARGVPLRPRPDLARPAPSKPTPPPPPSSQEDAALSATDLAALHAKIDALPASVWAAQIGSGETRRTMATALARAESAAAKAVALAVGLEAALAPLARGHGIDPDRLIADIHATVRESLTRLQITMQEDQP